MSVDNPLVVLAVQYVLHSE